MFRSAREQGQAALELLLVLLLLVPLLFGGFELARGVAIRHALDGGLGVATRALSLDPTQWDWAISVIEEAVSGNVLGGGSVSAVSVRAYNAAGQEIAPSSLAGLPFGTAFRLEGTVDYKPEILLVGGQVITLQVTHWGIVERYP